MENYDKELKTKLSNIKNVLNVNDVLARDGGTDSIRKYYKLNKLAYSIFHSKKGFVHAGLSESDSFKDEDLLAQPTINGKISYEINNICRRVRHKTLALIKKSSPKTIY